MTKSGKIPNVRDDSRDAMDDWCSEMADRGMLFHPDDPPDSIERIASGVPMFTEVECRKIDWILDRFMEKHGVALYDVCLRHTQRRLGIRPG